MRKLALSLLKLKPVIDNRRKDLNVPHRDEENARQRGDCLEDLAERIEDALLLAAGQRGLVAVIQSKNSPSSAASASIE
jgi:hypothetical protein